mmetsp:Transcript_16090/g.15488  ORF Transcript_16090/g.15488 Transcript_16090/m.15488 type:complete len:121 (-) Transcript_16090:37-399(-)
MVSVVEILGEISQDFIELVGCGFFPERSQSLHGFFEGFLVILVVRKLRHMIVDDRVLTSIAIQAPLFGLVRLVSEDLTVTFHYSIIVPRVKLPSKVFKLYELSGIRWSLRVILLGFLLNT